MNIIKEQLGRIKHFLVILILLFIVNAGFNLRYEWGGISLIARVYIFVLSFYIIFIFSQLNMDEYRISYTNDFGWKGKYYLFLVTRIFPFLFIYILTAGFTLINYINIGNWPVKPVLRLFDGRYSNTIIYSLILFMVLKQKKKPGISIPLFILCSACYFAIDKILYFLFEPGNGVCAIKISKFFIFFFILVYDFSKSRWKLFESVLFSVSAGLFLYGIVFSFFVTIFSLSPHESPTFSMSGETLLKSGFRFPLEKLQKRIINTGSQNDIRQVFFYTEKYGKETGYETSDWEKIIKRTSIDKNEYIFRYLNKKNIILDFKMIRQYALQQLQHPLKGRSDFENIAKYMALYYTENSRDFYFMYKTGNEQIKILILKSLAYTNDTEALIFLTDKLTNIKTSLSSTAYRSLKKATGKDPAFEKGKEIYDLDVVSYFKDYISGLKK